MTLTYILLAIIFAIIISLATRAVIYAKLTNGGLFLINGVVYKGAILFKNPATSAVTATQTVVLPPEEPPYKEN